MPKFKISYTYYPVTKGIRPFGESAIVYAETVAKAEKKWLRSLLHRERYKNIVISLAKH